MKKRIITALLLFFSFVFITPAVISAKKKEIIEKDGFYIVDGVLEKYTGEIVNGKEIILPKEVKTIGEYAFSMNNYDPEKYGRPYTGYVNEEIQNSTMKLYIPKDVKADGFAFESCMGLELVFEEGRKSIDSGFAMSPYYEKSICKAYLPKSLKILEKGAFSYDFADANIFIYLNEGLQRIEDRALCGTTIDGKLPKSIKYIGNSVFMHTKLLNGNTLYIPAKTKHIGRELFGYYLGNDTDIVISVSKKNKYYSSDKNGWLYSKDKKVLYNACIRDEVTVIPEGVEEIKMCAIRIILNKMIKYDSPKLYMPKSLKRISKYAVNYPWTIYFKGKKAPKAVVTAADDKYVGKDPKIDYSKSGYRYQGYHDYKHYMLDWGEIKKIYIPKKADRKEYIANLGIQGKKNKKKVKYAK